MIDWDRVRTLKEEVGPEDFEEVVELFFSEVEEMIEGLPQAADAQAVAHNMHFLKGAALNLGFKDMSRKCLEGETKAVEAGETPQTYDDIIQTYQTSKEHFIHNIQVLDGAGQSDSQTSL